MALAGAVQAVSTDNRTKEMTVAVTASGNYASPDTLNLTGLTNPKFLANALIGYPGTITSSEVLSAPAGYQCVLVPGRTLATWGLKVFTAQGGLGGGIFAFAPGGGYIKGSANTDQIAADQDNIPTNGDIIDTVHAVAGGAWAYSEDAEMGVARNVCITFKGAAGGSTLPSTTTATVTGTFRGSAVSEDIVIDFEGVEAIAAAKFRFQYGVRSYDTITSVVLSGLAAGQNGLLIGVGIGSRLGLPRPLATGAEADVLKLLNNGLNIAPSGIVNATYGSINFGTLADGDSAFVEYEAPGLGIFSGATQELTPGQAYPSALTADGAITLRLRGSKFRF